MLFPWNDSEEPWFEDRDGLVSFEGCGSNISSRPKLPSDAYNSSREWADGDGRSNMTLFAGFFFLWGGVGDTKGKARGCISSTTPILSDASEKWRGRWPESCCSDSDFFSSDSGWDSGVGPKLMSSSSPSSRLSSSDVAVWLLGENAWS